MQLWKKMKKNRKGFTLVEIIVVLVILAILAAFTIPAMLGFVNDAQKKAEIASARECYVAVQAATTELRAQSPTASTSDIETKANQLITGDIKSGASYTFTLNGNTVETLTYTSSDKNTTIVIKPGGKVEIK